MNPLRLNTTLLVIVFAGLNICYSQTITIFSNTEQGNPPIDSMSYDISGQLAPGPDGTTTWDETSFKFTAGATAIPTIATIRAIIDTFPPDEPSIRFVKGYLWTHNGSTNLPGTILAEWTFRVSPNNAPDLCSDSSPAYQDGKAPTLIAGESYWFSLRRERNIPREITTYWYNDSPSISVVAQRSAIKDFRTPLTITPWKTQSNFSPSLKLMGVAEVSKSH